MKESFDEFYPEEEQRNKVAKQLREKHGVTREQQTKTLKEEMLRLLNSLFSKKQNEKTSDQNGS